MCKVGPTAEAVREQPAEKTAVLEHGDVDGTKPQVPCVGEHETQPNSYCPPPSDDYDTVACGTKTVVNDDRRTETTSESPSNNLPTAPITENLPNQIGRFQIRAALGQGGFGTVYRAHDPILNREVALKLPRASSGSAEQLIKEARAAAPLRHPNIVAVFEAGADGDEIFLATEYVEGKTLVDRIATELIKPVMAAEWTRSLADALDYAHQEGVVHRDVKPHNIMVSNTDRAQLMDFGLAISATEVEYQKQDENEIAGTPAYMAPEQARGDAGSVGPLSDQYGLGAVLYELLTRQPPFRGGADVVDKIANGAKPTAPRAITPTVPRDLEAICLKSMSAAPQKRYVNCRAFGEDLSRFLNGELVHARWYSPLELLVYWAKRRPGMLAWAIASFCLLAVLLGSGTAVGLQSFNTANLQTNSAETVAETPVKAISIADNAVPIENQTAEMLLYARNLDRTRLALHQDDVILADRWLEKSRWDFRNWEYNYLRRITTGGWKTLHGHSGEVTAITMHPNGTQFASAGLDGSIRIWEIESGQIVRQTKCNQFVTALSFNTEGTLLAAATGDSGVLPLSYSQTDPTPLSGDGTMPTNDSPVGAKYSVLLLDAETLSAIRTYDKHPGSISSLSFSSDGRTIASAGSKPQPDSQQQLRSVGTVHVWNVETAKTEYELVSPSGPVRKVAFVPNTQQIIATTGLGSYGSIEVWDLSAPSSDSTSAPPATAISAEPISASNTLVSADRPTLVTSTDQAIPSQRPAESDKSDAVIPVTLMPTKQVRNSSLGLAVGGQMGQSWIITSPVMELWLLEQGRRRISGQFDRIEFQSIAGNSVDSTTFESLMPAVFDIDMALDTQSAYSPTIAVAGGDPLRVFRPGSLVLKDPSYAIGTQVSHRGHRAAVTAVAFRTDGAQCVTGDANGTLKIWNTQVHPEVIDLQSMHSATRVAFGDNGRYVAVARDNINWTERRGAVSMWDAQGKPVPTDPNTPSKIEVYDINNGRSLITLTGGPGNILGLAMDPAGRWVAGGGDDRRLRIWNLETGRVYVEQLAPARILCAAASRDGALIAVGCSATNPTLDINTESTQPTTGTVVVWATSDGREVGRWSAHTADVLSIAFDPAGKKIATSGADRNVYVWNLESQQQVGSLEAFDGNIVDLVFRPSGKDVAGVGFDPCRPDKPGDVVVWSIENSKQRLLLSAISGVMYGITYSPDGQRFATGGGGFKGSLGQPGEVKVYDAESGVELLPLIGPAGRNQKQESVPETYTVQVTSTETRTETRTVTKSVPTTKTITVEVPVTKDGDDGKPVVVMEQQTKEVTEYRQVSEEVPVVVCVPVVRAETRTRMRTHDVSWEEPGTVLGVAFSGDGRSLAAACENGSALVWDALNCEPNDLLDWPSGRLLCSAPSPDGQLIVAAGDMASGCESKGLIRIYNAKTGRMQQEIVTPSGGVVAARFASDSRRVISLSNSATWELNLNGASNNDLPPSSELQKRLSSLRNERPASSRCEVWAVDSGMLEFSVDIENRMLDLLETLPDGSGFLLAGDSIVSLHDLADGREIRHWKTDSKITSLCVSGHGNRIGVVTAEGVVSIADSENEKSLKALTQRIPNGFITFNSDTSRLTVIQPSASIPAKAETRSSRLVTTCSPVLPVQNIVHSWDLTANLSHTVNTISAVGEMTSVSSSMTPRSVLTGFSDGSVALVGLDSVEPAWRVAPHIGNTNSFLLPDERFATFGTENQLRVWRHSPSQTLPIDCLECERPGAPPISFPTDITGSAEAVSVTGDGSFAVVATNRPVQTPRGQLTHSVFFVDPTTGNEQAVPMHTDVVRSVAIRPDGEQYATVSQDMKLRITTKSGDSQERVHSNKLMQVVYSPDGKFIATSTAFDGLVWLWNADDLTEVHRFQAEPTTVFALAFDSTSKRLATAGMTGVIKLWDIDDKTLIKEWQGHEGKIETLLFDSKDLLASCGDDKTVRLWDSNSGEQIRKLEGFNSPVWDIAFSPDGRMLAAGALEPIVRIFDPNTGKKLGELPGHGNGVWSLAFSPDGNYLACCGRETPLVIWDRKARKKFGGAGKAGECLAWFPDSSKLLAGGVLDMSLLERKFEVVFSYHNPVNGSLIDQFSIPNISPQFFAPSYDGRLLAASYSNGTAVIWDRVEKRIVAECKGHQGKIQDMCFDPRSDLLATAGQDATVRFWDSNGVEKFSVQLPGPVSTIAIDPSGNYLAAGTNRTVGIWSIAEKRLIRELLNHYGELCDVAFSPNGRRLASTSRTYYADRWQGDLKVWDVETGDRQLSIPSHTWWNAAVAFNSTGNLIATTGKDHTIFIVNALTGKIERIIPTYGNLVSSLAFTSNRNRLLAPLRRRASLIDATPDPSPFGSSTIVAEQSPAEASAARWVLQHGGNLQVLVDGIAPLDVNRVEDLPLDPFWISRVSIGNNTSLADEDLSILRSLSKLAVVRLDVPGLSDSKLSVIGDCSMLREVYLNGTMLTDEGLEAFLPLKQLRIMHLNGTGITNAGVDIINDNASLEDLELHDTKIDDAALPLLVELKNLKSLGIARTSVTNTGIDKLKKLLPNISIKN